MQPLWRRANQLAWFSPLRPCGKDSHPKCFRHATTILVTGGAGFIGSNFVLEWNQCVGSPVVNLDLLTYAGNPANLNSVNDDPNYLLVCGDICNSSLVGSLLNEHRPKAIVHFAAEAT